jgi:hypothetical protein
VQNSFGNGVLRLVIALAAGALLAACATSSAYQPQTEAGGSGYAEERLEETRWRVEFTGGDGDSQEIVESRLLYRAAELTVASGYDWFLPSAYEADAESEIVVEAPRVRQSPVWRPQVRRGQRTRWTDWMPAGAAPASSAPVAGRSWERERYAAREEITMGRGAAPSGAFEARRVMADLNTQVQ